MKYCPKCGKYSVELCQSERTLKCHSGVGCDYSNSNPVDIARYEEMLNDLPLLACPLDTPELKTAIDMLSLGGTFDKARNLDRKLRDEVRRALEARRHQLRRAIYGIDYTLSLLPKEEFS